MYRLIKAHDCGISSLIDERGNCHRVYTDSVDFQSDCYGRHSTEDAYVRAQKATLQELIDKTKLAA